MKTIKFSPIEEDIIDSISEQFDIPRLKAIEHFIEHKRITMKEAFARGDIAVAKQLQKELGE